jgi:type II secretory pathway pseudopilin PulG
MVRARAFTLLEVLIAAGMLGILTIALFRAFDYGAKAFRTATDKQDAQSATKQIYSGLRDALRRSHFRSISLTERLVMLEDKEYRRDALCMGDLKDWSAEASYDELNGLPKWDRYVVYYASRDGKLVVSNVDPDRPDFSPAPFGDLDEAKYLRDDPNSNTGYQSSFRILSRDVLEFRCLANPANDTVRAECLLEIETRGRKRKTEIDLQVFPQNTWPKGESL